MQSFTVFVKTRPNHVYLKRITFHKLGHYLRSGESLPCLGRTGPIPVVIRDTHDQSYKVLQDFFRPGLVPWDRSGSSHEKLEKIDCLFCQSSLC